MQRANGRWQRLASPPRIWACLRGDVQPRSPHRFCRGAVERQNPFTKAKFEPPGNSQRNSPPAYGHDHKVVAQFHFRHHHLVHLLSVTFSNRHQNRGCRFETHHFGHDIRVYDKHTDRSG